MEHLLYARDCVSHWGDQDKYVTSSTPRNSQMKRQSLFDSQLGLQLCYPSNDRALTEISCAHHKESSHPAAKDQPLLPTGDRNLRVENTRTFNKIHHGGGYTAFQVKDH